MEEYIASKIGKYFSVLNSDDIYEPNMYICVKNMKKEYNIFNLRIDNVKDMKNIIDILKTNVSKFMSSEYFNIDEYDSDIRFLYKKLAESDKLILDKIKNGDNENDYEKSLKVQRNEKYLVIEHDIDEDNKIYLIKEIKRTQFKAKRKISINIFEGQNNVKIINSSNEIILDDEFNLLIYEEKKQPFIIINKRKIFEELFEYVEKYTQSYIDFKKEFPFIDWSKASSTISLSRQCYGVKNFPDLKECFRVLKDDLLNNYNTSIKRALSYKKIKYEVKGNEVTIIPKDTKALKSFLKIIKDGVVHTVMLEKEGISNNLEKIE